MFDYISSGWLIARTRYPEDSLTRIFAGVIQNIANGHLKPPTLGMGMSSGKFSEFLDYYFPEATLEIFDARFHAAYAACVSPLESEFEDILAILLEHRSDDSEVNEWLAYAIASGCMGSDHLYHDMGMPDRKALSSLIERYFTSLYVKNVNNMKWKKFLYKQVCERADIIMCPTRNCLSCVDYKNCFSPEEAVPEEALC